MTIPLVDLHAQYLSIKEEIDAAISNVIAESAFVRGHHVERFERDFAAAIGAPHCVSCANGTDALYIAMVALGVKPGDEVIVPAMSWISTSETVTQSGGQVVFCDIDPLTHTLDPERLADVITAKTVGVIPVHLYGHPAPMAPIMAIAKAKGLWVLEDCAQAHLAAIDRQRVGTFGTAGTFSFYPGKNLGAMGDAGAIVTADSALAERMAMFARHGGLRKHEHKIEGINSRLDGLQAAILNVKLTYLPTWTKQRRQLAMRYTEELSRIPDLAVPGEASGAFHVWHLYTVHTNRRDEVAKDLHAQGVHTSVNYSQALPFLPCYRNMAHVPEQFRNAYNLSKRTLSLPLYPELRAEQQDKVISILSEILAKPQQIIDQDD